jgi:predicted ATP-grasp superfamily ATP-dependent carboligase
MVLKPANTSVPVFLLSANTTVGSLSALRSLGRWGVELYGFDAQCYRAVWSSRYCRGWHEWDLQRWPAERCIAVVRDAARALGCRPLLVPTVDEAAIFAAEHQRELAEVAIYPEQDPVMVAGLVSKREMYWLARHHGVPVPQTSFPQDRADVVAFLADAQFPVALKAIRGSILKQKTGVTAFIVRAAAELLDLYDRYEDPAAPNAMLQEYIPGEDSCGWGFNGYFDEQSQCLFGGTTQRLHQHPVHVGMTSLAVITPNHEVQQLACDFMRAVGYRGLVNIGFRFDARDGRYKVVDVNPRLGASFRSFVTRNDCDILRSSYLHATGQPIPSSPPALGRRWLMETDLHSLFDYRREGHRWRDLLLAYRGVRELAHSGLDDPRPAVAKVMAALRRRMPSRAANASDATRSRSAALSMPQFAAAVGTAEERRAGISHARTGTHN